MEQLRSNLDQKAVSSPETKTISLFQRFRSHVGAQVLAIVTSLGALTSPGCDIEIEESPTQADSAQSSPSASSSATPKVQTEPEKARTPDLLPQPDTIITNNLLQNSIENFTAVFKTPTTDNQIPIFYLDPYKGFQIVQTAQMPGKLSASDIQNFHDEQRKQIAMQPNNQQVRIRINSTNPNRELPIVGSVTKETSLATAIEQAQNTIILPGYKKPVQLIEAISDQFDRSFPSTQIYKDLQQTRQTQISIELLLKNQEIVEYKSQIRSLQANKAINNKVEINKITERLNETYRDIVNLEKEKKQPILYTDRLKDLLIYGLLAQESHFAPQTASDANALGYWQIQKNACLEAMNGQNKQCSSSKLHNPLSSSLIAIQYFDRIYSKIQKKIQKLEDFYGVNDPNDLLFPCLITAYNSGYERINTMIDWHLQNADPTIKTKIQKGEMNTEDLFLYISISFYHANSYEREKNKVDGLYGHDCVSYFPKIAAWASIIPEYLDPEIESLEDAKKNPSKETSDSNRKNKGKSSGLSVTIPEEQLSVGNYPTIARSPVGNITITGGFMESHGHSRKNAQKAIFGNGTMKILEPSDRNLGIDYKEASWKIRTWYGGTVLRRGLEGGYGNRITIQTDVTYLYNGKNYVVYQAYAHAASFLADTKPGQKVHQSQHIGTMGGTGKNGKKRYSPHIDLRTYIVVNNEKIDLSLNALEKQLKATTHQK